MRYVYGGVQITFNWTIWKKANTVKEDFDQSELRVLLYGPADKYYIPVEITGEGDVAGQLPESLPAGVYSMKAFWTKRALRANGRVLESEQNCFIAITYNETEVESTSRDICLHLQSAISTYGKDGLSAYEIAVLLGQTQLKESEWSNVNVDLAEAEHERVLAEEARDTAEAGRVTAEQGRVSAETGRVSAEESRVAAEASRVEAEEGRVAAETARGTAETARENAEDLRELAETARGTAESSRRDAEDARELAEQAREDAFDAHEAARQAVFETSEASRAQAFSTSESARTAAFNTTQAARQATFESSEEDRTTTFGISEAERAATFNQNENARAVAEAGRVSAEQGRVSAEQGRVSAESSRVSAEAGRVSAEASRVTAEEGRLNAETSRVTAEEAREAAEEIRQENYAETIKYIPQELTSLQQVKAKANLGLPNDTVFDVSKFNEYEGELHAYADLTAALEGLPAEYHVGGVSIKFINSVSGKYETWTLMDNSWSSDVADWQGVDDEPTAGSENLVKSGGVEKQINNKVPYIIISESASSTYTYHPLNIKQGHKYVFKKTNNFTFSGSITLYLRVNKNSESQTALSIEYSSDFVTFTADKDYNWIMFYIQESTQGGTMELCVYDTNEFLYNAIDIKSKEIANEEIYYKLGGTLNRKTIHVTSGEAFVVDEFIRIKSGETFNIKLLETNIVNPHANAYLVWGDDPTDASTRQVVNVPNTGLPVTVTVEHDIKIVRFVNSASRNVGTGDITFELYSDEIYARKTELADYAKSSDLVTLSNKVGELDEDVDVIKSELNGVPGATVDAGNVAANGTLENVSDSRYNHLVMPVNPGSLIHIVGVSGYNVDYCVLKTYPDVITEGLALNFSDSIKGRQRLSDNTSLIAEFTVPNDAHYIVTSNNYQTVDNRYRPSVFTVNGMNAFTGENGIKEKVEYLERGFPNILRYTKSAPVNSFSEEVHPRMEYLMYNGVDKYFSLVIEKCIHSADTFYQNIWRITGGYCYNRNDITVAGRIASLLSAGENEFAFASPQFHADGDYTGGFHGGERIDVDAEKCFVKFFANGELLNINDSTDDFEISCDSFRYVQKSTLHVVTDYTTGAVVEGHPVFAYHVKNVSFKNCDVNIENTIDVIENSDVSYSSILSSVFHAGLVCISKEVGNNVIIPDGILKEGLHGEYYGGSDTRQYINADNLKANRVLYWNTANGIGCEVSSELTQGIDDVDVNTFMVWDRTYDSKYYRRISGSKNLSQIGIIRNKCLIDFL